MKDSFIALCNFCEKYNNSPTPLMRNDPKCQPAQAALAEIQTWAKKHFGRFGNVAIGVDVSKGAGFYPKGPWICLLPPNQQAANGVYVSICFSSEGNGAVAGLAQSVTNPQGLHTIKRSKNKPLSIDVDGVRSSSKYNDSFQNPQEFFKDTFNEAQFKAHIEDSLAQCLSFLSSKGPMPVEPPTPPATPATPPTPPASSLFGPAHQASFLNALTDIGFVTTTRLPENLLSALAAKPFLILTGNSGTGKTKLAELFAHWLCPTPTAQVALIAIGADWTDNRNVLGFVNHLRLTTPTNGSKETPLYQSTGILDLLLAATLQPELPFFLILDEMNLSHVERYFADFLSAMESTNGSLLLHREGHPLPRKPLAPADVPEILPLPRNVFVIGTVNVDETTYMFSPKVLDRANVLEFRVAPHAPQTFLQSGGQPIGTITPAPTTYAKAFLALSLAARGLTSTPTLPLLSSPNPAAQTALDNCHSTITDLFALMQRSHQEFAFRSMAEILRFLAIDHHLTSPPNPWSWQQAMDAQILQKILPKLHGSKRKIGSLLAALATYCEASDLPAAEKIAAAPAAVESYSAEGPSLCPNPHFKNSHKKLCEMILSIRRDQFTSFIQ